ncbi:uncharacterized protein MONBRDRAFT_16039 [Monosiga brevicollis MX1]|uniref:Origin recognition complex subunit 5 n=1 Tax=Monosiga brevicollis TaxID=81824 RepID=A9UVM0_MONBE|nr:uncharacterized protein MONBRDRAFT_16039 [Monosiga brevicollis MX1]EDQ90608.1 predicted protein [Monosiga brevicollis MX1]|eukprot:XP_001744659.1 hypothetical protein [Monosiga brevicollis MX1]
MPVAPQVQAAAAAVVAQCPGREEQIEQLFSLLGAPEAPTLPCLHIYGATATGKSHVMRTLLEAYPGRHAMINCIESYSQRLVFEHTLNLLAGEEPSEANGYSGHGRCDHPSTFVDSLRDIIDQRAAPTAKTLIVLDHSDRLRDQKPTLLALLLRLQELTRRNVCVVSISHIVWEKFECGTGMVEPLRVPFPAYNRRNTVRIITLHRPANVEAQLFQRFVELLWDVFHGPCRVVTELGHLVTLLLPKWLEPIQSGELQPHNFSALFQRIKPVLQKQLTRLYLRDVSTVEWAGALQAPEANATESVGAASGFRLDLPYHAKYLLLAAYLASSNPPRADLRLFAKRRQSKKAKRGTVVHMHESQTLKGPRQFTLDRLLAIFHSIHDGIGTSTSELLVQIQTLISLRMLHQVRASNLLDDGKYKVGIDYSTARALAQSIDFDLNAYLYEAVSTV